MPINTINTLVNGSFNRTNFNITTNGTHRLTDTTLLNANGFTYAQNTNGDRLIATSAGGAGEYMASCYMRVRLQGMPAFNYSLHMCIYKNDTLVMETSSNLVSSRSYDRVTNSLCSPVDTAVAVNDYFYILFDVSFPSGETLTIGDARLGLFKL